MSVDGCVSKCVQVDGCCYSGLGMSTGDHGSGHKKLFGRLEKATKTQRPCHFMTIGN